MNNLSFRESLVLQCLSIRGDYLYDNGIDSAIEWADRVIKKMNLKVESNKRSYDTFNIIEGFEQWDAKPGITLANAEADAWPYSKEARREAWNAAIKWVEGRK